MNILITAGGTIEQIDDVRTINNMSTGKLASVICNTLTRYSILKPPKNGKMIERLLSPVEDKIFYIHSKTAIKPSQSDLVELIEVKDTNSLKNAVENVLSNNKIDIVIHSMAVSDYTVDKVLTKEMLFEENSEGLTGRKISSDNDEVYIKLKKTPKIINMFKEHDKDIFLIGFKLLSGVNEYELDKAAKKQIEQSGSDVVVANDLQNIKSGNHKALFIDKRYTERFYGKDAIAEGIYHIVFTKKTDFIEVDNIFCFDWYDGPITGLCKFNDKLHWYIPTQSSFDRYFYDIYEIPEKYIDMFLKEKSNFEKYVGTYYSYDLDKEEIDSINENLKDIRKNLDENYFWNLESHKKSIEMTKNFPTGLKFVGISNNVL